MFPMCSNQVAFKTQCVHSTFPQVPNEFLKIFPIVVSTISELPFMMGHRNCHSNVFCKMFPKFQMSSQRYSQYECPKSQNLFFFFMGQSKWIIEIEKKLNLGMDCRTNRRINMYPIEDWNFVSVLVLFCVIGLPLPPMDQQGDSFVFIFKV